MIADLGTKALSSARLNQLKRMLGMSSPPSMESGHQPEVEEATSKVSGVDQSRAKRLVQILSLVATLQKAAGQEGQEHDRQDDPEEDGDPKDWIPLVIYTLTVLIVTLVGRSVVVSLFEVFMKKDPITVDEEDEESEDVQAHEEDQVKPSSSRDEFFSLERPRHLPDPLSDLPRRDPSEHQKPSGHQGPNVAKAPLQHLQPEENLKKIETKPGQAVVPKGRGGETQMAERKSVDAYPKSSMAASSSSAASEGPKAKALTVLHVPKAGTVIPMAKSGPIVRTTRYGTVYHVDGQCRFLTARGTGASRAAQLCEGCRLLIGTRGDPMRAPGDLLKMRPFALTYHVPDGCNESTRLDNFQCCTACNARL